MDATDAERQPAEPERPSLSLGRGPAHNWRILVAVAWIGLQLALVATAGSRADGSFGFRMFAESSTIKVVLWREVDGPDGKRTRVHVDHGVWGAKSLDGRVHRFSWYDRVPPYWLFDQEIPAAYGSATQLVRLQGALDDVAAHVGDDAETARFVLDVSVRRNGREPVAHQLVSKERITTTHEEVR